MAPADQRFDPHSVSTYQLQERVSSLKTALADCGHDHLPVIAAGHSVGGWADLCVADRQPWTRYGRAIMVPAEERVSRLVLFAPRRREARCRSVELRPPSVQATGNPLCG